MRYAYPFPRSCILNLLVSIPADHTVELQFLDKNLKKRGICTAVSAFNKLHDALTNTATEDEDENILQPLLGIISSKQNLNFLSKDVNNRVHLYLPRFTRSPTDLSSEKSSCRKWPRFKER
jgi:hypothetical protein